MAHHNQLDRLVNTCLITGMPGVGYETIISELAKRSFKTEKGDSQGFRYSSQHSLDWFYHLDTVRSHYSESQLDFVSMGGKSAPNLLYLPWRAVFVLQLKFQKWHQRANSFRKKVDLLPLTAKEAELLYKDYRSLIAYSSLYSGNVVYSIDAAQSVSSIADEILRLKEEVSIDPEPVKSSLLYSELTQKPKETSKFRNIYSLVGTNGVGKSYLTAKLRESFGLLAYTGDHLRSIYARRKNEVDWNSKLVLKDNILKNYDVISYPRNTVFDSKRPIVSIGIVPDPVKWRHYLYQRNISMMLEGGHYPHVVSVLSSTLNSSLSKCDHILYNDFTDRVVENLYKLITSIENIH